MLLASSGLLPIGITKRPWHSYPPRYCGMTVHTGDEEYVGELCLPGVREDEVVVEVDGTILSVNVKKDSPNKQNSEEMLCRMRLPGEIDGDNISAELSYGILRIRMPRNQKERRRTVKVKPVN